MNMNKLLKDKNDIRYFRNGLYIFKHLPSDGDVDERIDRLNQYYDETIEISKFTFWFIYSLYVVTAIILCIPTAVISLLNAVVSIAHYALTKLLDKLVNLLDV